MKNLVIVIIVAMVGFGLFALLSNSTPKQTACTQEARECLDGSYVSRTGPNCEFSACPFPRTVVS